MPKRTDAQERLKEAQQFGQQARELAQRWAAVVRGMTAEGK